MRSAMATNLASSAPATTSTGMVNDARRSHSGRWVPVPARRRLDASPAAIVAAAIVEAGVGECGEHRLGQPAVEEGVDAVALDGCCKCIVSGAAGRALVVVLDARRGADEHEPLDEVRAGEREVEAEPAAHRVADVAWPRRRGAEHAGAGDEVGLDASPTRRGQARRP